MADDGSEPSRMGDIAEWLRNFSRQSLGPARAKLIAKGIIYAPEHGVIAYTVPGMSYYVMRRESLDV